MAAKIISFMNLKGGVGKTTTTVGTAYALSKLLGVKILVIDVDPQTNATAMMIGEERWKELADSGKTLYDVFNCRIDLDKPLVLLPDIVCKQVGNLKDVKTVDLIPSSPKILTIQDNLFAIADKSDFSMEPDQVFERELEPLRDVYDFIFVDCPPNMGVLTRNGLRVSDGYVIPTVPDILSTYGIDEILAMVELFDEDWNKKTQCYGIVATKVKRKIFVHEAKLRNLQENSKYKMFNTVFWENSSFIAAAEFTKPLTMKQKWGNKDMTMFIDFAKELYRRIWETSHEA